MKDEMLKVGARDQQRDEKRPTSKARRTPRWPGRGEGSEFEEQNDEYQQDRQNEDHHEVAEGFLLFW